MFGNKSRRFRNIIAIFSASVLSLLGIFLSVMFLEWELQNMIDMDEYLFLPSLFAFVLVGGVIGWIAYFEDVKKITWNFISITLIFGLIFPIIVGILVSRDQLSYTALANIALFPGSWVASYIIYKSADYFALNFGHDSKSETEDSEAYDAVMDRLYGSKNE